MCPRAWNLSGLAVRSAQALGLHLRDVSDLVPAEMKEFNAYNWYALMTLESMLTLVTGRPTMINPRDCSVTIPRTLADAKSPTTIRMPYDLPYQRSRIDSRHRTSSLGISEPRQEVFLDGMRTHDTTQTAAIYFVHYAELCMLAKEVVGELYKPGIRKMKWADIQSKIERLDRRLFEWKDGVNPPFESASPSSDPETESCRVTLRILFYSTRTIINRPCLCRIGERIQDQSRSSTRDELSSANKCVESARATLSLILHKPDSTILHEGTMWWMLLHHLKRALTVLLLELAFRAEHMPSDAGEILAEAKAAVHWLHDMGKASPDARRTFSRMRRLLQLAAQKVGGDTSDMPTSSEEETAPIQLGHQQRPLSSHDDADHSAPPPRGFYGGATQDQLPYDGDLNTGNELDQFGFLRAEGGRGSLFPTASEMERMSGVQGEEEEEEEDDDDDDDDDDDEDDDDDGDGDHGDHDMGGSFGF